MPTPDTSPLNPDHGASDPWLHERFAFLRAAADGNGARAHDLVLKRELSQTWRLRIEMTVRPTPRVRPRETPPPEGADIARHGDEAAARTALAATGRGMVAAGAPLDDLIAAVEAAPDDALRAGAVQTSAAAAFAEADGRLLELVFDFEVEVAFVYPDVKPAPEALRRVFDGLDPRAAAGLHMDLRYAGTRREKDHVVFVYPGSAPYGEMDVEIARPGMPTIPLSFAVVGRSALFDGLDPFLDTLLEGVVDQVEHARARDPSAAGAHARAARLTARVAEGGANLDALAAAHAGTVSKPFLERAARALDLRAPRRARAALTGSAPAAAGVGGVAGLAAAAAAVDALGPEAPLSIAAAAGAGFATAAAAVLLAISAARALIGRRLRLSRTPRLSGAAAAILAAAPLLTALAAGGLAWRAVPDPELDPAARAPLPGAPADETLRPVALGGPPSAMLGDPETFETQWLLSRLGFYDGPIDGRIDAGTRRAAEAFRAAHPAGGRPGARTLDRLRAAARDDVVLSYPSDAGLIGRSFSNLVRGRIEPADLPRVEAALKSALAGGPGTWISEDGARAGRIDVRRRLSGGGPDFGRCVGFAHAVRIRDRLQVRDGQYACRHATGRWILRQG